MPDPEILRYAAFTRDPSGGNPAGVVLDARGLTPERMQAIAAEVGYSETAFLLPAAPPEVPVDAPAETPAEAPAEGPADAPAEGHRDRRLTVRYFSPLAEVPFCGHATIAAGVALAQRDGPGRIELDAAPGRVDVDTRVGEDGLVAATLTSVDPAVRDADPADVEEALAALHWSPRDLDPALPPGLAFAGAWHLVLAAGSRERLARLDYDMERLGRLMAGRGWTTVHLVWREAPTAFHVRDPFPPGGVVEDPATGAAAAAFGAYLRELGLVDPPARLDLHQGQDMGRPSHLVVDVGPAGPVRVTGTAVPIPA